MLRVPVELNGNIVTVLECIEIAGSHRPPNPQVAWQAKDHRAERLGDCGRLVRAAVVNDHHIRRRDVRPEILDHLADAVRLVICRYDN